MESLDRAEKAHHVTSATTMAKMPTEPTLAMDRRPTGPPAPGGRWRPTPGSIVIVGQDRSHGGSATSNGPSRFTRRATPNARGASRWVGPVGLEPTTYGLKVRSSAIELETLAVARHTRTEPTASLTDPVPSRVGAGRRHTVRPSGVTDTGGMSPHRTTVREHAPRHDRNRMTADPARRDGRPRRPLFLDEAHLEAAGGWFDPIEQAQAAHESAAILVHRGRACADPQLTARFVALAEEVGLDTLAQLWAARPPRSLPGALWRLYVLRDWVRRDAAGASREYTAGMRYAAVNHVVAGPADPPGPVELQALLDAVLAGVFDGDLAVAFDRAAAFCRVVSAGRAAASEGAESAQRAADLLTTGEDLTAAAAAWRRGGLS